MRIHWFLLPALAIAATAQAEVKELDGEEMLDTYVQGISISQVVTDTPFDTDGEELRETATEQQNLLGDKPESIRVQNAEALDRDPTLDQLLASTSTEVRNVLQDSLVQTGSVTHLDISIQRAAAEANMQGGVSQPDFAPLETQLLELLPSATGYQFEFANRGF